jgi:hypothetical protein
MAFEGVKKVSSLFKKDSCVAIAEGVKLSNSFPSFINEEDNQALNLTLNKGSWERITISDFVEILEVQNS